MFRKTFPIILLLILVCVFQFNCSSGGNPVIDLSDPSTFPGTYKLKSITFKTAIDEFIDIGLQPPVTFQGDKATNVPIVVGTVTLQAAITISGTLTLTQNTYTNTQTITIAIAGLATTTETDTDTGTYSISGNQLTAISDDPDAGEDATTISAISVNGSQMTLEDDEVQIVFTKQA